MAFFMFALIVCGIAGFVFRDKIKAKLNEMKDKWAKK